MNPGSGSNALIYVEQDMADAESVLTVCGRALVQTVRCPGKETPNEDAAAIIPVGEDSIVLAVADGMGGAQAGERAAREALSALRDSLAKGTRDGMLARTAILNGIEQANEAVMAMGIGAATTLAVAETNGQTVRSYHAGDSVILAVGQRGRMKLQTVSHAPVSLAVESGHIDESEAMCHGDRHLVSNFVGSVEMRVEVGSPIRLAPRDTLLLASDGLSDNLYVDEIVARIRCGPIGKAARALADDTRRRMAEPSPGQPSAPDDLTFILFRRRC